jgi:3-dehydroquinate dehydratase/shikimate dehydrogenase
MTYLTVAIMVDSAEQALADAAQAAERGADLVEYRFDRFADDIEAVSRIVTDSALPCIATCRPSWEGGEFEGDDGDRLTLFEALADLTRPPAYIDVELAIVQRDPAFAGRIRALADRVGLIYSSHDFDRRPADLYRRIQAMADDASCRVMKVAWASRSLRDNLQAFEIIADAHKPTIALCMGEAGLPSRVLARKFGALLTFAGLDDRNVTAPGQVGVAKMKSLYRWDKLNADTAVYGVIGWPVAHSMSPAIHNAGFDETDADAVYLLMPIPPEYEHFKATVGAWLDDERLDFRGASVTIPHKENLIRYIDECGPAGSEVEPLARQIGAANTLTLREDGSLLASNTDYAAALDSVCDAIGIQRDGLSGKRVAVIGAGGVARAVVAGFAHHGATIVIYNRTVERAEQLAAEFRTDRSKIVAAPLDKLCQSCAQVFINCTSVGMDPDVDQTPMPDLPKSVREGTIVFDTIYNPVETRLLREARAAGATTINGVDMFVRQGAAQFHQWTGRTPPIQRFETEMLQRLIK